MDTSERQIKRIVLERMDRCSVCHRAFQPDDIHVISRKPDVWMMVVQCVDCHARNFVAALVGDGDPTAAQMALRQLSAEHRGGLIQLGAETEPEAEPRGEQVNVDDVIEMHEFLGSFDGNFKSLFAKSRN